MKIAKLQMALALLLAVFCTLGLSGCASGDSASVEKPHYTVVAGGEVDYQDNFGAPGANQPVYDSNLVVRPVDYAPSKPVVRRQWGPVKPLDQPRFDEEPVTLFSRDKGKAVEDDSDPFADLNQTLGEGSKPAAPADGAGGPTFRVIATAEGDIGHRTATGRILRKWDEGAALPSRKALGRDVLVRYLENGVSSGCTVGDVGPWNTNDPYWEKPNGRPQAESGRDRNGRRTNKAGIDLFNATWYKLLELRTYDKRLIESTTGEVEWQFAG